MWQPWTIDERDRFWRDILQALARPFSDNPIKAYVRERGLRFLVQTKRPEPSDQVRARLIDAWGRPPGSDELLQVEPLFTDEGVPERLALFHLAVVEGLDPTDLEENPYDACYTAMALDAFLSVQPDLAFMQFPGASTSGAGQPVVPGVTDLAWALRRMNVDQAWALSPSGAGRRDGQGVLIAHLDTGRTSHDDLDVVNQDLSRSADFIDPHGVGIDPLTGAFPLSPGHGTRTGSVMMSRGDVDPLPLPSGSQGTSGPGKITGVARQAGYVPIRCIRSVMVVFAGDIARAVRHATAKSCHVVSMSLGGRPARALRHAIQDAVAQQLVVVAAAGNHVVKVVWPARYPECIAMAASNELDAPWSGSSRGAAVALSAPGQDVWVAEPTAPPGGTGQGSGTSYATAHMAGVAALWLAFHDRHQLIAGLPAGHTLQELFRAQACGTARQPPGGWDTARYGAGIVDVLRLLASTPPPSGVVARARPKATQLDLSFLGGNILRRLADARQGGGAEELMAFEHELANLELDHDTQAAGQPGGTLGKMSRALRSWLSGER